MKISFSLSIHIDSVEKKKKLSNSTWQVQGGRAAAELLPLSAKVKCPSAVHLAELPLRRPSLRSSLRSTRTCTAWASWCATSRTTTLWGERWRRRNTTTSSPTSPSSTTSAKGDLRHIHSLGCFVCLFVCFIHPCSSVTSRPFARSIIAVYCQLFKTVTSFFLFFLSLFLFKFRSRSCQKSKWINVKVAAWELCPQH